MNFSLVYLVNRFFYRLGDFFHHWYVDASRYFFHAFISLLERLDKTFAIGITFRYLFQPLYKDYSPIGRLFGFVFRFGRIVLAAAVYAFSAAIFLVFYLIWLLILPAAVFYVGQGL